MVVKIKKAVPLPILGLDTSGPSEYLDSRATPDCMNMELYRRTIRKRLGTSALGSSLGERVMGINQLQLGSEIHVVRMGLTKVEVLNQGLGTWSSIASAVLTGTLSDRFSYAFPVLSGAKILVYTNGIDAIRKYTGTGNDADLGGSPPVAKYVLSYKGYLLLGHITDGSTFAFRLRWSDTGDPETWTGGNSGTVDLIEDDQEITGMSEFGDFITIHKNNSIYVGYLVTTSEIFRFDRKSTGVGTVANDTIRSIPTGEQIFLASDGIHLFNGITAPLIQSPVMDEMREEMNPEYIHLSWGVVVRELDEYWVGVPLGSDETPSTVYKYNYRTGQVYKDSRDDCTAVFAYQKTTQITWDEKTTTWDSDVTRWNDVIYAALNPTVIFGDSAGVTSERAASNSDISSAISSYWISKDFTIEDIDPNEMGRLMRWTDIQVWSKGGTIKIEYSINEGSSWTNVGTFSLTSAYPSDSEPLYGYFDVISTRIRFRFSNMVAGESFDLKKFIVETVPREVRR
jgi:hypothetical protein